MAYSLRAVDRFGLPFQMVDEGIFVIPKKEVVRLNKHHFKVLFILDGQIEHEIEGLEGRRPLAPGDILIAPIVGHHCYINPSPMKAVSLQVVRIFLDGDHLARRSLRRSRNPEMDLSDFVLLHFREVRQLTGGIDAKIHGLISEYRAEAESRSAGYRHRIRSICVELLVVLARKIGEAPEARREPKGQRSEPIVTAAREYVVKHFAKDLTLGEIAWHVGKGEEHLARVFKRKTGQSVFDYVREVRVGHAKTLLSTPTFTLTEVAARCGFHSLSFFSRTFHEYTGMPPSQYRSGLGGQLQSVAGAAQRRVKADRRKRAGK